MALRRWWIFKSFNVKGQNNCGNVLSTNFSFSFTNTSVFRGHRGLLSVLVVFRIIKEMTFFLLHLNICKQGQNTKVDINLIYRYKFEYEKKKCFNLFKLSFT